MGGGEKGKKYGFTFDNFSGFSGQATKDSGITSTLPISAIPGGVC